MSWDGGFRPYVSVAQRRAQAAREVARRTKKGEKITPVQIEGRKITTTFWGDAWCKNLESYSDYASRLPRGRTYVRNGSVVHLEISRGQIKALVSGSELYEVKIEITPLPASGWLALKKKCAGQMGSLVELLQGKLSKAVMETVTDRNAGLFPKPQEIKMRCSCPDHAGMCKHVAAVMYGVGNRLDLRPELLFQLRGVDQQELIEQAIPAAPLGVASKGSRIDSADLGDIFGIEIGDDPIPPPAAKVTPKPAPKVAPKPAGKPAKTQVARAPSTPPSPPPRVVPRPAGATKARIATPALKALLAPPRTQAPQVKPPETKSGSKPSVVAAKESALAAKNAREPAQKSVRSAKPTAASANRASDRTEVAPKSRVGKK